MGELVRSRDWSTTPLGPVSRWPVSLRTAVDLLLEARHPMLLFWGPELIQFYNDAFQPSLGGEKHPAALGQPARECWADAWPVIGSQVEAVMSAGESTWNENFLVPIDRGGRREEVYWTYGYSPVRDESGAVGGVLVVVTETTGTVVAQRRLRTLGELAARTADASSAEDVCGAAVRVLSDNPHDVPFALVYLLDREGRTAELRGQTGMDAHPDAAPESVFLAGGGASPDPWSIAAIATSRRTVHLEGLRATLGSMPGGPWPEPSDEALILPIAQAGQERVTGVLVAGLSARRPFDSEYRGFLELVADRIATAVAKARAYEHERERAEALAAVDRAKTTFFSNVSHEFRTPLTLLLGHTEDALEAAQGKEPVLRGDPLRLVHRNGLRLLRLVNALLDFSKIEAGRIDAIYQPTDLAGFTTDLASTFRSAAERAGLELRVEAPALSEPVYVDRQMWEKIVLNLLSNALKYTTEGRIVVRVRQSERSAVLEVEDTGIGIPPDHLPRVFDRFHSGPPPNRQPQQNTGIGLALVREMVRLHGGEIVLDSAPGKGTLARVAVPLGSGHLAKEHVRASDAEARPGREAAYAAASLASLESAELVEPPGSPDLRAAAEPAGAPGARAARVLVVDDDPDIRGYVARLLGRKGYRVETAADGPAALAAAEREPPDLVLADVMMPGIDGFGLLAALRSTPATREIPIMLLSARAGEEARIEGLGRGADDYLVKPFGARELLARVESHLELARVRRETQQRLSRVFLQAPVAVSVVSGPEFVYELANPLYLAMVGRNDLVGQTVREAFPELPDDAPVFGMLEQVYATGERFTAHEYPLRLDRGQGPEDVYFMFTCQPIRNGAGAVSALMTVAVDVTEQVRARQEVEHARREAQEANQAKAAFLATMSHELRTPLTAIIGYSHLLAAEIAGPLVAEQKTQLGRIELAARHLLQIIEGILNFSRLEAGREQVRVEQVDLVPLAQEMASLMEPLATAKGLAFHVDLTPTLEIETDPGKVRQILLNLLSNAIKFTSDGEVRLSVEPGGDGAIMRVTDTGPGIDAASLEGIFDPFFQVIQQPASRIEGTGLGLSVTRQLARLLGGDVEVQSEKARGSTFTVRLPLRPPR